MIQHAIQCMDNSARDQAYDQVCDPVPYVHEVLIISSDSRILSKQIFGLVIHILLEYSTTEAYNNAVFQGVGGNDGTGSFSLPTIIQVIPTRM